MWHFKVPIWMAYLLLLFCGLAYSCGSAEYEINGECCPMCTPGARVYKHCTEYTSTSCVPCTQKSFTDVPNGLFHCLSCTVCEPDLGLKTERECTPTSDTVCGPLDHHYCTKTDNKGCSFAQKHTICRPGQLILHNGTTLTNTECGDCPDKTFSNEFFSAYCKPHTDCQSLGLPEITAGTNTSDNECGSRNIPVSIAIVTVLLVLVSVVILTVIFILKRRKKDMSTDPAEGERMTRTGQPQDEGMLSLKKWKYDMRYFKVTSWMPIRTYLLIQFCGLAYSCGSAYYEINGQCCHLCLPGAHVYKHCTEYTSTSCVPCPQKSFNDEPNGRLNCYPCTGCDPDLGLKTERECTPTSDTVCGPLDHHYCTKTDYKGCTFAQKHTICRPGQFIIRYGTTSTNTECGYCPDKTFSNEFFSAYCKPHTDCQSLGLQEMTAGTNTSDSECGPRNIHVSIVIGCGLLALSAVILLIIFILWWRKQNMVHKKQTERERNYTELSQDTGLEERLEPISARSEQEAGEHLGQVADPLQGLHTIYSRTHAYRLICLPLDCGRKPKYPEDTHTDMERKYKLVPHRKVPTRNLNTCCCEVL